MFGALLLQTSGFCRSFSLLSWLILILVSTSSETGLLTVHHNGLKGVRNAKNSTDQLLTHLLKSAQRENLMKKAVIKVEYSHFLVIYNIERN